MILLDYSNLSIIKLMRDNCMIESLLFIILRGLEGITSMDIRG